MSIKFKWGWMMQLDVNWHYKRNTMAVVAMDTCMMSGKSASISGNKGGPSEVSLVVEILFS